MPQHSDEGRRLGWAFFWLATGAGAMVALVAAPEMPQWSIQILVILTGVSFTASAYYFRLFVAPIPIGTLPRSIILLAFIWLGIFMLYQRLGPRPRVIFPKTSVYMDKPNLPMFANISFRNTGAKGKMSAYGYSAITLPSAKSSEVRQELRQMVSGLVSKGGGLVYSIEPQDEKWFTLFGPTLTPDQDIKMKQGALDFYFFATMVTDPGGDSFDYCGFVVGGQPNAVLDCED